MTTDQETDRDVNQGSDPQTAVSSRLELRIRMAIVAVFLFGPPLLAIPAICDWKDGLFYRETPRDLSPPEPTSSAANPPTRHQTKRAPAKQVELRSARSQEIQRQLQGMGANYMLMEQYGDQPQVFRFVCRVDDPAAGQTFVSLAPEPLDAMERVLADVAAWKQRR